MKTLPLFSGSGSAEISSLSHWGHIPDPADIYPGDLDKLKNPPGPSAFSLEVMTVRDALVCGCVGILLELWRT